MSVRGGDGGTRWAVRLALARVMQVVVFTSPVVAAVGVSSLAHLAMGTARSRAEQARHLAVPSAVTTVAAANADPPALPRRLFRS